jgi:hypothetical protein
MEWTRTPVAAGSFMCVACLAVAAALPAAAPVAEQATKTVNAAVRLAVDFSQIAGFSAIPIIQQALSDGDLSELLALGPVDGIPALAQFASDGNLADFVPDPTDGSGGYAALSGLNSYATGNLPGIAGFSALGAKSLGDIAAFSAIPVFAGTDGVLTGGGVNALGGYAALSAIDTFVGDNNGDGGVFTGGGINALAPDADGNGGYAALSALPVFAGTDATGTGTGVLNGGGVGALSGYAALSAIPAYLAPTPAAPTETTKTDSSALTATHTLVAASTPPADPPATTPKVATKQPTQSYSASFAPKQVVLFGSGGGKNASDNGIRGWGSMLKKIGIGASGSGGTSAGSAGSAGKSSGS